MWIVFVCVHAHAYEILSYCAFRMLCREGKKNVLQKVASCLLWPNDDDYAAVYFHAHNNLSFSSLISKNFYLRFSLTTLISYFFFRCGIHLLQFIFSKSFTYSTKMICNVAVQKSAFSFVLFVSCISICRLFIIFSFLAFLSLQCVTKEYFFFIEFIFFSLVAIS